MSLTKQLFFQKRKSFTLADNINWQRVETLVHGPGASDLTNQLKYGDSNSAVFACLMAVSMASIEPPKIVYRNTQDGKRESVPGPLQELLNRPTINSVLSPVEIDFWLSWALHTDGNAYLLKTRSGNPETGNVIELWPVSPLRIAPYTEKNSGEYISYYKLEVAPGQYDKIPPNNVIHFRLGLDDRDMRLGVSPLKRLIREIATDYEATKFTESILKNYAIPGLVVVPSAQVGLIDKARAEDIANIFDRKLRGEGRGRTAVLSQEATIHQFGFSPDQMDLDVLHRIPEERIAAVIGIPAIIAGLGAGLERSTYSNFREAREMFTESRLIPYWRMLANRLTTSLVSDFYTDASIFIDYDLSNVRALQQDEDALYRRLDIGVRGRWIGLSEARVDVGLPPELPDDLLKQESDMTVEEDAGAKMLPFGTKTIRSFRPNKFDPDPREIRRLEKDGEKRIVAGLRKYADSLLDDLSASSVSALPYKAEQPDVYKPLQIAITAWLTSVAEAGVMQGQRQIEMMLGGHKDINLADWELPNLDAAQWAIDYSGQLIKDLIGVTLLRLRRDIELFVTSGEELESLVERIRDGFLFSDARARRIAATETTRAYAQGNQLAWRASGIIQKKLWRTAVDELVCPICGELNGQVVKIDESFTSSTLGSIDIPPAHVNCRCWIVPEIVREVTN